MNQANEFKGEPYFDHTSFANDLLEALDKCNEKEVLAVIQRLNNNIAILFRQFVLKFDKQASLLKHIFSSQYQKFPMQLRNQIQSEFLNSLDYIVRNSQIYSKGKKILTEIYYSLTLCTHFPHAKRTSRVNSIILKSFMYCYEIMEGIGHSSEADLSAKANIESCEQIWSLLVTFELYTHAFFLATYSTILLTQK